jgi:hypothetical protein
MTPIEKIELQLKESREKLDAMQFIVKELTDERISLMGKRCKLRREQYIPLIKKESKWKRIRNGQVIEIDIYKLGGTEGVGIKGDYWQTFQNFVLEFDPVE